MVENTSTQSSSRSLGGFGGVLSGVFGVNDLFVLRCDDRWYDDNDNEDDDANTDAHSHLHILPPHLLPDTVRAAPEALRRDGKVVGLILESIETFTSLRDLVDVLAHHIDGVVDLSLKSLRPRVSSALLLPLASLLAAGDVGIIGGVLLDHCDGGGVAEVVCIRRLRFAKAVILLAA